MTLNTVVWNMQHKESNWRVLTEWDELKDADIALLCEAPAPPDDVSWIGLGRTEGLDFRPLSGRPVKRAWSTAVLSGHPAKEIADARLSRWGKPLSFGASRPGTWTAASIAIDGLKVTAVSLYGLMDEKSDASVHRALSELSPLFDHKTYGGYLLLGGDLNILANPRPNDPARSRHLAVLSRIKAYGLVDCLEKALLARDRPRGGLPDCPCELGDACTHTWTKRVEGSSVPYQDDYLFASLKLADCLTDCRALPFTDENLSDHAPIIGTFEI